MFDQQFYNIVFQALHDILRNNINTVGQAFANQLLLEHDINKGNQQNAQMLLDWIGQQTQRVNGTNQIQGEAQLFQFLGMFVTNMFQRFQQQNNRYGGGGMQQQRFAPTQSFQNNPMGGSMSTGFGMNNQNSRMSGGAHLSDDGPAPIAPTVAPAIAPQQTSRFQSVPIIPQTIWSDNPLDDLTDTDFTPVKAATNWGTEKGKERRIVVAKHDELKSKQNHVIHRFDAYHQLIQNNPLQVVKDFFDIVPDSTLGLSFLFQISYNHLDVIEVPTHEFQAVRLKCMEVVANRSDKPLHKHIAQILNTMQVGAWKAITSYLVKHVNRALYLSCRLSNSPKVTISIDDYEDLDTLLSSEFRHAFTTHPEGRYSLEKIVSTALWNALVMNSAALFTDGEVPTVAMQLSPAFPFSMNGVYPNKFAIPANDHTDMGLFKEKLQSQELVHRTYILSRRSVIITNILGKNILPQIGKEAAFVDNSVAKILGNYALPYLKEEISDSDGETKPNTFLPEDSASDQLHEYLSLGDWDTKTADRYTRIRPVTLPVDRTMFAVQYGIKPETYLQGLDVVSTFDSTNDRPKPILVKHDYSEISPL